MTTKRKKNFKGVLYPDKSLFHPDSDKQPKMPPVEIKPVFANTPLPTHRIVPCFPCEGSGLVPCKQCKGVGPHSHVCYTCRGSGRIGQYMAADTLPGNF